MSNKPINIETKISLLLTTILFHLIFMINSEVIFRFNEIGGALIAIICLLLLILLLINKNKTFKSFQKLIPFEKLNSFKISKAIKLFLLFIIPISLFGIYLRILIIKTIPINAEIADMLPLIEKAGLTFMNGQNPYQIYFLPHKLPLTFWPLLWLSFLPAISLNLDLRWIGLILWVIISFILILYSIKITKIQSSPIILFFCAINILLLQISSEFIAFHAYGHTYIIWLLLLLVGISVNEKKWLASAILLGLLISSRQTAFIFLPILFALWYHQLGLKKAFYFAFVSFAFFFVISLPFFLSAPKDFLITPIQHYKDLGEYYVSLGKTGKVFDTIGFSYLIQKYFWGNILSVFSVLIAFVISILSFIYLRSTEKFPLFMALTIVGFTFFTPIPWKYEYFPALIFLFLANFS